MKVPDNLVSYATKIAARVARNCNLDPNTVQSITGELVVTISAKVETEEDCFKLFSHAVRKSLISRVVDELTVFGPKTAARRKRRQRQQQQDYLKRWDFNLLPPPASKVGINMVDFIDQFSHDPKLQEFVFLLAAGYTQTELKQDFGYTRIQIDAFKEQIADVYGQSKS